MALSFNDENSLFNFVVKEGNGIKGVVDSGITEVPSLYIQPPHMRLAKQQTTSSSEVTTIDLSELDGPNHAQVVKAIAHAAETLGFFQVVNHGVPLELLESLKGSAHQFFSQPPKKKAGYLEGVSPSPVVKYGTSFVPELEKVLQWRDFVIMTYTNDVDALEFWPNECKEAALMYIKTSNEMVKRLVEALISYIGVKLDDSRLDALVCRKLVSMNFYPKCPTPELTVGALPHSDISMVTMLLQDDIGGLYVKKGVHLSPRIEEWIEVPPIEGALVINIGDALQVLSNGRYKSVEHRVQTTNSAARVSVVAFCGPSLEAKFGPLPELVARDGIARYKELIFKEYRSYYFRNPEEGKKSLGFAST